MDMARQSNGRQPIGFPLIVDDELIGIPMYLWRMPEAYVPRAFSYQHVMYHNIDKVMRMLGLLQSHAPGGEEVNGDDDDDGDKYFQNLQE